MPCTVSTIPTLIIRVSEEQYLVSEEQYLDFGTHLVSEEQYLDFGTHSIYLLIVVSK